MQAHRLPSRAQMSTIKAPEMIKRSPTSRSTDRDACFVCRQKGHWASDCHQKSNKRSSPSLPSAGTFFNDQDFPEMQCPCGAGNCPIRTSKTTKNPHRKFYCCPNSGNSGCKFFKWCDTVTRNGVLTEKDGKDAGRKYFARPVKKDQQSHNTYTQNGGGIHNPLIQGVNKFSNNGSFDMGFHSSWTTSFNNHLNKGASGGVVRYLGYTLGLFIAALFGILVMRMYGYF